jgi:hypothetical protein
MVGDLAGAPGGRPTLTELESANHCPALPPASLAATGNTEPGGDNYRPEATASRIHAILDRSRCQRRPRCVNGDREGRLVVAPKGDRRRLPQAAGEAQIGYLRLSSICRRLRGKHRSPVIGVPRLASAEQRSAQDGDWCGRRFGPGAGGGRCRSVALADLVRRGRAARGSALSSSARWPSARCFYHGEAERTSREHPAGRAGMAALSGWVGAAGSSA